MWLEPLGLFGSVSFQSLRDGASGLCVLPLLYWTLMQYLTHPRQHHAASGFPPASRSDPL